MTDVTDSATRGTSPANTYLLLLEAVEDSLREAESNMAKVLEHPIALRHFAYEAMQVFSMRQVVQGLLSILAFQVIAQEQVAAAGREIP